MTTKQPDRFEREVHTLQKKNLGRDFHAGEVVKLLRKEHEAVATMIKKNPLFGATANEWKQGYTRACQDILDQLNERGK